MNDASPVDVNRHPARPGGVALALGLLLAPAAWMAQTTLAQTLAAWGCFPHERPVNAPALPWLEHGLLIVASCALLLGVAGAVIAWGNWRRTGELASVPTEHGPIDRHAARDTFIARAGALASALFVFALIATDLAWLLVSPCGGR
ncbi:hypothetical protein [Caballeronia ptereochthonis]|uniref:Cytochrome C oxidase subunit I n=1 Tax=Caballeronia ptereochthonis TaxID=1777144 RepID=A0A158B4C2_9BURK|nr:hypothetical protein [Caballeronia ptereochthonis]SAK64981.1 hypothetical protein AWB83_02779 [Caballeronia ptereochthonis]